MGTYGKIIPDMTNEDYHSHPAVSKSGLDEFNRSPYHYWLKYLSPHKPPVKWTDAFTVGAALHALVLEPQHYERDFYGDLKSIEGVIADSGDALKAACEEAGLAKSGTKLELQSRLAENNPNLLFESDLRREHEESNRGKIYVNPDQQKLCEALVSSINAHPKASEYLGGFGAAEHSYFFEYGGLELRCRPDYIRDDGMLVDVKTAQSANPHLFNKKAFDFRYHVQAAMYSMAYEACTGKRPAGFTFVVVEKAYPHCVLVAESSPDFIAAGYQDLMKDLHGFAQCKKNDEWPSYNQDQVFSLEIPSYKQQYYKEAA